MIRFCGPALLHSLFQTAQQRPLWLFHIISFYNLTICRICVQKRPVEDSDWRKNVEAMSGMEGRKKMFDAAKGSAQWGDGLASWAQHHELVDCMFCISVFNVVILVYAPAMEV